MRLNVSGCLLFSALVIACGGCKNGPAEKPASAPSTEEPASHDVAVLVLATGVREEPPVTVESPPPESPTVATPPPSRLLAETLDGYALVRLPVRGFEKLSLAERTLSFHLYQASLAGRDITYDQNHRLALLLRQSLEAILRHSEAMPAALLVKVRRYAKRVWIANGPYDSRTQQKLAPGFSKRDWRHALDLAREAGATIREGGRELERLLFEPGYEPLLTCKSPPPGRDILQSSANNYYKDVRLSDLRGFEEKHPLNSRLVRRDGDLFEEVYRTGREASEESAAVPPGRYAAELSHVNEHLRAARAYAPASQRPVLEHLIEYFETGEPSAFEASNIAWVAEKPSVDLILGFVETYHDARGAKGEWEGLVTIVDRSATALMQALVENAQYFENRAPWADEYKRRNIELSVLNAVQVLGGHGGGGPTLPTGISLPNSETVREQHGSKSLFLTNVIRAINTAVQEVALETFALPDERAAARRYSTVLTDLTVALHEVLGHGSGKMSEGLIGHDPAMYLKEYTTALVEARAELITLHHIWDPRISEIAPTCGEGCPEAAYRAYVRLDLMNLRRVRGHRIEDDHIRATRLIVQYARAKGAVELREVEGAHYQVVTDLDGMRGAIAELLKEVTRTWAEGDYDAAKRLFQQYGLQFDTVLRDEIVTRSEQAGIPANYAFIMPELIAIRDAQGHITDVRLKYMEFFEEQMLRWGRGSVVLAEETP